MAAASARDVAEVLASRQHGVVARFQLRPHGTRSEIRSVLSGAAWSETRSGVFVHRAAPATSRRDLYGALLRCGPSAVVSHASAFSLWGVSGFDLLPAHVTRLRGANQRRTDGDVAQHEMRRLGADHVGVVDGFPVTTPSRTVADMAARIHPDRLERIVDSMLADRLVTVPSLARTVEDLSQRGRRGIPALRAVVDARGRDYVAPASRLEARLRQLLAAEGLTVRSQVDVGGTTWVGRVDFVVGNRFGEVLVEVQSERFHDLPSFERDDRRRFESLREAGFVVVAVDESTVWHRPRRAVGAITSAIRDIAVPAPRPPA